MNPKCLSLLLQIDEFDNSIYFTEEMALTKGSFRSHGYVKPDGGLVACVAVKAGRVGHFTAGHFSYVGQGVLAGHPVRAVPMIS